MTDEAIARLEAALIRLGHGQEPPPGWEARVLAAIQTRRFRLLGAWRLSVIAVGTGLVIAELAPPRDLELVVRREPRGPRVRGSTAHIGDLIHVTAAGGTGFRAIWVYRNEAELVVACPGAAACPGGHDITTAVLTLASLGRYTIVALSSAWPLPPPRGSYDAELAAAAAAGATMRVHELDAR